MEVCVFPPNNQDQAAEGRHMWPRGRFLIQKTFLFCLGGNSFLEPIVVQDLFYSIKKTIVLQSAKNCVHLVQSANTRFHSMGISKCIWLLPIFKRKVLQSGLSNGFVLNSIANPTLICVTLWLWDQIRPRPSLSPSHDFPENIPNPYHQHWGPSSEKPVRRVFGFSGVDILPPEEQSCVTN